MENPASWTPVHHAINKALDQHTHNVATGTPGPSLTALIYNRLKELGMLREPEVCA